MSVRLTEIELGLRQELAQAPAQRACDDQSFELPPGIYIAMAALLGGFLAVLAVGLANPGLAIPMAINFVFLTAFFSIPTIFVATGNSGRPALKWSEFMRRGVRTETGHSSGGEAAVLILMLPALIFLWSLAVVIIYALV